MRALIIEDDKPLSDALCRMLGSIAETEAVYDGESGLNKILTEEYDIVILDIMLPKMNGEEVLRGARRRKLTPIIILSAIGMLERKVEFLNLGADDYMVKPFLREELLARVQATMRRCHRDFGALRYRLGDLNIDYKSKMVQYKDKPLPINGKMYDVLETLVKNKEITVTKQQLFDSVCGFYSETIQSVIEVYVYRLRKILTEIGMSDCLQTIKTVGYRWTESGVSADVEKEMK
ncbi:MAG: response regulator transcription factor [Clostridia bacterium]|nr:response regulator transcription factor [Clostridia bacterium]MDE7215599.1 response regulator transcription factor [Clostridia bacterium]